MCVGRSCSNEAICRPMLVRESHLLQQIHVPAHTGQGNGGATMLFYVATRVPPPRTLKRSSLNQPPNRRPEPWMADSRTIYRLFSFGERRCNRRSALGGVRICDAWPRARTGGVWPNGGGERKNVARRAGAIQLAQHVLLDRGPATSSPLLQHELSPGAAPPPLLMPVSSRQPISNPRTSLTPNSTRIAWPVSFDNICAQRSGVCMRGCTRRRTRPSGRRWWLASPGK